MMNQANGVSMGTQSGLYNVAAQTPMGQFAPPPPGGYQPDSQNMNPLQGYIPQVFCIFNMSACSSKMYYLVGLTK